MFRKIIFWIAFIPCIVLMMILGFLAEPLMAIYDWYGGRLDKFEKWALERDEN